LESEVENDGTSVANFELVVVTDSGPQQGIAAANISLASSRGATDTITKVDTATNRNGRFRFTVVSSTGGNPVFTATVLGRVITETATVQFGAVVQPAFEFTTAWADSTGSSSTALRDGTTWDSVSGSNTNVSVIASTGLDFPSTNVLSVQTLWNGLGSSSRTIRKTGLGTPAISDTRYYRFYLRVTVPDGIEMGTPHPVQDGFDAATSNWLFEMRQGDTAGKYTPVLQSRSTAFPNTRYAVLNGLDRGETYRIEIRITRTGSTTYTQSIRIYDSTGTLALDDSDFLNQTGTGATALSTQPTFTLNDAAYLDGFTMGTNGAFQGSVSGDHPLQFCYQGAAAISDADWCGVYVSGEAP